MIDFKSAGVLGACVAGLCGVAYASRSASRSKSESATSRIERLVEEVFRRKDMLEGDANSRRVALMEIDQISRGFTPPPRRQPLPVPNLEPLPVFDARSETSLDAAAAFYRT